MFVLSEAAVPSQLRHSLVLENEANPIRQTVYFQTNSVWPAASHTFRYFQTGFQKRDTKALELLKHDIPKKGPLDPKSTKRHPT